VHNASVFAIVRESLLGGGGGRLYKERIGVCARRSVCVRYASGECTAGGRLYTCESIVLQVNIMKYVLCVLSMTVGHLEFGGRARRIYIGFAVMRFSFRIFVYCCTLHTAVQSHKIYSMQCIYSRPRVWKKISIYNIYNQKIGHVW